VITAPRLHCGPSPLLLGANTLDRNDVYHQHDEDLGDIQETMLMGPMDGWPSAALSYGGLLGMGKKLFAVP